MFREKFIPFQALYLAESQIVKNYISYTKSYISYTENYKSYTESYISYTDSIRRITFRIPKLQVVYFFLVDKSLILYNIN